MAKAKRKRTSAESKSGAGIRRRKSTPKKTNTSLDHLLTSVRTHPEDISARLELAEYYLRHGQGQNIIAVLEGLEDRYPFVDRNERGRYNFVAAFGHLDVKQLLSAEKAGRGGLKEFPDSCDFLLVLTIVHSALREYGQVIRYASRFHAQYEKIHGKSDRPDFCTRLDEVTHVHDHLGTAFRQTGKLVLAEESYRRAIESDTGNHSPYLNLARLYRLDGKPDEAKDVVETGIGACRQVQELRMLRTSLQTRSTISACMMVKNEEELLPDCLDSIRDWVDEIVVVDTGSSDRTVEIAESYGARVYHQPWEGNFSKHRNYTLELATCEWVCIIDADERFGQRDVPALLSMINNSENDVISVSVHNRYKGTHDFVLGSNSVRLWRRDLGLQYHGIVHNALDIPENIRITPAAVSLEHLGYDLTSEKMEAKFQRTMALLREQLDRNPQNGDAWFNVAQLLRGCLGENSAELASETLDAAMRAIQFTDSDSTDQRGTHVMSHNHVAAVSFLIGNLEKAEEYAKSSLKLKPDYLDPLMLLGMIYNRQGKHEQAIQAYQTYLDVQAGFDEREDSASLILYYSRSRDAALYGMGQAALAQNEAGEAQQYFRRTLDQSPDYSDASLQLGNLYLLENRVPEAQQLFQKQINGNRPLAMAAAGLAYTCSLRGEIDDAINWYQRAVELEPENPVVLGNCGVFFRTANQPETAAEYIERSLAIDDSQLTLKRHLSELWFAAGRYDAAMDLLLDILERGGEDPEVLNDLGNCCFKMNQLDTAEEYYKRATVCPQPPACSYRNLGLALAGQHKAQEASEALVTYSSLEPEDKDLACLLGDLYLEQGQFQMALEQYEKFLQARPNDVLGIYRLSECYRIMGHSDSATMGYRRVLELDPDFTPASEKLADATTTVSN